LRLDSNSAGKEHRASIVPLALAPRAPLLLIKPVGPSQSIPATKAPKRHTVSNVWHNFRLIHCIRTRALGLVDGGLVASFQAPRPSSSEASIILLP
jgi:hypothetical protein